MYSARVVVTTTRGMLVAFLVFGAIGLLCHLSLLMGNETVIELVILDLLGYASQ